MKESEQMRQHDSLTANESDPMDNRRLCLR